MASSDFAHGYACMTGYRWNPSTSCRVNTCRASLLIFTSGLLKGISRCPEFQISRAPGVCPGTLVASFQSFLALPSDACYREGPHCALKTLRERWAIARIDIPATCPGFGQCHRPLTKRMQNNVSSRGKLGIHILPPVRRGIFSAE